MTNFWNYTDKDVFQLFLEISGYGQDGIRIGLEVPDNPHVLEKIANLILVKISTLNVQLLHQKLIPCFASNYKLKGDVESEYLKEVFVEAEVTVTEIAETEAKELD